jgi:hypothetical protein
MDDPGDTREELRTTADSEAARFRAIFEALAAADPDGTGLTTAEIIKRADTSQALWDAVAELCDSGPHKPATSRALSNRLKRFRGRVYKGRTLDARENRDGLMQWRVTPVAESAGSAESPTPLTYAGAGVRAGESGFTDSAESAESAGEWDGLEPVDSEGAPVEVDEW